VKKSGIPASTFFPGGNWLRLLGGVIFCFFVAIHLPAQTNTAPRAATTNDVLVMIQGTVEVAHAGQNSWSPGVRNQILHQGDRVRTGERSRAEIYLSGGMTVKKGEFSEFEVPPAGGPAFKRGIFEIFHRDRDTSSQYSLPGATAAVRGTDFLVKVDDDGHAELTVLDGLVILQNDKGQVELRNHERGIVDSSGALSKTAVLEPVNDLIQWSLYYPAVVNADELEFTSDEKQSLGESLQLYRTGDLMGALAVCPWSTAPSSDADRIFRAALLLSVGQVEKAEAMLGSLPDSPQAHALRQMIAVVKMEKWTNQNKPASASEWIAESYSRQSSNELAQALEVARAATTNAPNFGFAWERVAELEFSFGRTSASVAALDKALRLSPKNAQALALKGFLLAAQNNISAAISWFDQATAADSALANAWLGRGLCQIRRNRPEEGLRDLLVAASLEPQRSVLRSYLGKAFADVGDEAHANKELKLAREIDPNDPTSWLYSALLRQQENRINEAAGDLQTAQELNDNRSVFRSRLLLDQDRAVGSANLASIYRDLGMTEQSLREASRGVTYDYSNPSAHLFISDAFNDLRDPTRFNLRYETVWFNELLLANILSPVGGGRLSQEVSQQEYSKLFESDGLGFATSTDARSDKMLHEQAAQYGTFGNTSYALDLDYQNNGGVRVNNNLSDIEWNTTIKQQITPQDTAMILVQYENYHSGDNFQYYDQSRAQPFYKFDEYEEPILVAAWHHEWGPGMHTMVLLGRLVNEQYFSDKNTTQYLIYGLPPPDITQSSPWDVSYHNTFEIYSSEVNQICEWERVTLSLGGRYQAGNFQSQDSFITPANLSAPPFPVAPPTFSDSNDEGFERVSGYGYATVKPVEHLWLTGGVAYDRVRYPDNFRFPPVNPGEDAREQIGPKAAFLWNPISEVALRGAFTRSLGGVSLDESYRLEPTQLNGFPQAFRSLVSESAVGSVAAPKYETLGVALDLKLGPRTFAGIEGQRLKTDILQTVGAFLFPNDTFPAVASSTPNDLNYREYNLTATINQLLGDGFVIGASYKLTMANLDNSLPEQGIGPSLASESSRLHQIRGYILYNHPSGFFAEAETLWFSQDNYGFNPAEPGDSFVQQNFYLGYRFAQRRVELTLGLLNVTGGDYKLEPLTIYQELPRKQVVEARLNFEF